MLGSGGCTAVHPCATAPVGLSHTHRQLLPSQSADERMIYEYILVLALALQPSEEYS